MQITRICKSLIIIILKNMIIFLKKHVHVFHKSRTCFSENTYDFSKKHVRVFSSLVINLLQNGNSHRTYCKIKHPK